MEQEKKKSPETKTGARARQAYKKQAVLSWIALVLSVLCLIPQIIILVENVRV
jgi:hypothetical protein